MIEIALMLAGAETAVSSIKKAISIGKSAHECLTDFMNLFDTQDAINKASVEERSKNPEKSAMSEAMESVVAAKRIKDMMAELQRFLVYSGQGDVWNDIMQERNAVIARRKAAALAEEKARKARIAKRQQMAEYIAVGVAAFILLCLILYGVYIYAAYLRR